MTIKPLSKPFVLDPVDAEALDKTTIDADPMEVRGDVKSALDVLRTRGWGQGHYVALSGKVCALGALGVAVWGDGFTEEPQVGSSPEMHRYLAACGALQEFLPPQPEGARCIPAWNDAPGRTQDEVEALFQRAADGLEIMAL